nr:MAG TPA: hypothetical protein [Caudoviricetes sp.]
MGRYWFDIRLRRGSVYGSKFAKSNPCIRFRKLESTSKG